MSWYESECHGSREIVRDDSVTRETLAGLNVTCHVCGQETGWVWDGNKRRHAAHLK